ncbi:MAG: permease-like cell division protein FtsX [Erysipelotrichaceae bacterium]|nr:permease-like cell division protein FtsX [Erysipelotrichaceae bacterium]
MINRFLRHIKEGFYGVGRHSAMSVSSASAVTITLLLISIFLVVTSNLEKITSKIENSVKISVIVSYDFEAQEDLDRIDSQIKNIAGVKLVTFSDKETEFDFYINSFPEEERVIFEPYRSENPMHHAFYVEVNEGSMLQEIASKISAIEGVEKTNYGGESSTMLVNALATTRQGGFILVIALSLLAIYLVQNTIKLTIFARSNEIWIMRNVGAKNGYIRAPFVVEGIIIGMLGAIIPILTTIFAYIYLYNKLGGKLLSGIFVLIPPHPFVLYISCILLAVGIGVGFIGSFFSVTKYLRWKR